MLLAAADPAPLIALCGVLGAALIAGIFGAAGRRSTDADKARAELLADKNERIAMLTTERDEARSDRDSFRRQCSELERKIARYERRPTRETKP